MELLYNYKKLKLEVLPPFTKTLMMAPNLEPATKKSVSYLPVFKAVMPYSMSDSTA